jgi:DNA-3-methyladenine glycosylase II
MVTRARRSKLKPETETPATLDEAILHQAIKDLCKVEPRFAAVVKQHGPPALRRAQGGLPALLQMVTEQFLSLAAAATIWARLEARMHPCDAQSVLACSVEELKALGLSGAKAKSFLGLAGAVADGRLDFDLLHGLDDAAAQKMLVSLPGIGPWTADIYLLSVMQRANVWPWGDVALQASAQHLFNMRKRPDKKRMIKLGESFRPWRAVAARLLWAHYRGMKNISQA